MVYYKVYGMQQSINQKGIEETIKRVLNLVENVEYFEGSDLVYVRKKGDLSASHIAGLAAIGLSIRNITSYVFKNKYGMVQSGLEISLEIAGVE